MSAVWRCRMCEGVNRGGRVCVTCGAEVPRGEPLRAALRTVTPSNLQPAHPPLTPEPTPPSTPPSTLVSLAGPSMVGPPAGPAQHEPRDLRTLPAPEEIHPVDSEEPLDFDNAFDIRPLPGGCLMTFGPRRSRSF